MKPVAAGAGGDPSVADVKALIDSGSTAAAVPRTREMLEALVEYLIADSAKRRPYVDFLDAEYALGSAYVHGSQGSFFDVADDKQIHPRTRILHRRDEVLRAATSLLALLAGLELRHKHDLGVNRHRNQLQALGPYGARTSMAKHNALVALFGLR